MMISDTLSACMGQIVQLEQRAKVYDVGRGQHVTLTTLRTCLSMHSGS